MKIENEKEDFISWCRFMFEENCQERWSCGQQPYKSVNVYYNKNKVWLRNRYQETEGKKSIYLS
jgi:hypothetical protein